MTLGRFKEKWKFEKIVTERIKKGLRFRKSESESALGAWLKL